MGCPMEKAYSNPHEYPRTYRPLREYLSICPADADSLKPQDASFDCSILQDTCNPVECFGVNDKFIQHMVIEADCYIETYLIQCFFFILLFLYHAIMLNIC